MIDRSRQYYIKGTVYQMIIKNTLETIQIYYKIRKYTETGKRTCSNQEGGLGISKRKPGN